jgi:mannose-6-phosphate isomerase-like protein (cupin superfamily)
MNESNKTRTIKIIRLYAEQGKSFFGELEIEAKSAGSAPPPPQMNLSAWFPTEQVQLMLQPPGWAAGWHYAPKRFLFCILAGEFGVEVSNGQRQFRAGELVLVEDRSGQGHRGWVVGNADLLTAVVQLSDNALVK